MVFHRILDKAGLNFYSGPFFIGVIRCSEEIGYLYEIIKW
jgi:hypothetical protein